MTKYVIEARKPDGSLDLDAPQPESVFGEAAITGITEDAMAKALFRKFPEDTGIVLRGDSIATWPALVDSRWKARPKTW